MNYLINQVNINEFNGDTISDLTELCDGMSNSYVSIYLIRKERFIYSNSALNKIIGNYSSKLIDKNWDFWYSIINEAEISSVRNKINNFFSKPYVQSPFVLRYHIIDERGKGIFLRHELMLHQLNGKAIAINYFFDISAKENVDVFFRATNGNDRTINKKLTLISPREKEVLILVANGFSSKQIADKLNISNHTAISHRKSLIIKFKVKNTAQLIMKASRRGELW